MEIKLFDYQIEALEKLKMHKRFGLFFRMGRGKTLPTLLFLDWYVKFNQKCKILVIAPLNVAKETWSNEIKKWGLNISYAKIIGNEKKRLQALNCDVNLYLTNRETVDWLHKLKKTKWDIIVVDEISNFKDTNSIRYRRLCDFKSDRFIALTGSPSAEHLRYVWAIGNLIQKGILYKYKSTFMSKFFYPLVVRDHNVLKWGVHKFANKEIFDMLSPVSMYKEAVEIPVAFIDINIKLDSYITYRQLERYYITSIAGTEITASNCAVLNSKLRQLASGVVKSNLETVNVHTKKVDRLLDMVESANGKNILVWYDFISSREAIIERLEKSGITYTLRDIDGWNEGLYRVFIAHPKSFGLGVNLQQGGHIMVWYDLPYSLELYEQGIARMVRTGQKENVEVFHFLIEKTVDPYILISIRNKDLNQLEFLQQYLTSIK